MSTFLKFVDAKYTEICTFIENCVRWMYKIAYIKCIKLYTFKKKLCIVIIQVLYNFFFLNLCVERTKFWTFLKIVYVECTELCTFLKIVFAKYIKLNTYYVQSCIHS